MLRADLLLKPGSDSIAQPCAERTCQRIRVIRSHYTLAEDGDDTSAWLRCWPRLATAFAIGRARSRDSTVRNIDGMQLRLCQHGKCRAIRVYDRGDSDGRGN